MSMKIAIIPARGGSKRIPRKNIKNFLGKPIIAYSIEIALASNLFDEVMVSTDDEEIAEIAKSFGAKVPFLRSKKNANDYAGTLDVIFEVLDSYRQLGKTFDYTCCIYPTAPFVSKECLTDGFEKLLKGNLTTVFPVVPYSYPILRSVKINDKGLVEMNWPEYQESRSQDLPIAYHDAGQWYWISNALIKDKLFTTNTSTVILSELEVQDVDNEGDWKLAEMKYTLSNIPE